MIVRSGSAVTIPVLFSDGLPDGPLQLTLYDGAGAALLSTTLTAPAGAVSGNLLVNASYNTLTAGALFAYRTLAWSYTTLEGVVVNGEAQYTVEARLPYGVSPDGVRSKLGVTAIDLPNEDVGLVAAYLAFRGTVTEPLLSAVPAGGAEEIAVRNAIEALAALSLIPTMAVRVASKESSGTNSFARQDIDWQSVAAYLDGLVLAGYVVVNPVYDVTSGFGALFLLAPPASDAFTGA